MEFDDPFKYFIIDDFLELSLAEKLSNEFLPFDSDEWFSYENPLEIKKTIHNWYSFPSNTYKFLSHLNSKDFIDEIKDLTGTEKLYGDHGLHGGGWHIHGRGGKLNIHLDYEIHPKMNLLRKYNLIIYLSKDWDSKWGGNLEFWSHDDVKNCPKEKKVTVECKFNRAVLFDASQNSWHGFSDPIDCPKEMYRKSIAVYYLTDLPERLHNRRRALYSPTEDQKNDKEILELITKRSGI